MDTKEEREDGRDWEVGIDIYKCIYIYIYTIDTVYKIDN